MHNTHQTDCASVSELMTTGELAAACGVSVRTVQYYDERGLVQPVGRSEGRRRLYDDAALERLRAVCTLKALGLSLAAIRGVLDESADTRALLGVLDEQELVLEAHIAADQATLAQLKAVRAAAQSNLKHSASQTQTLGAAAPQPEGATSDPHPAQAMPSLEVSNLMTTTAAHSIRTKLQVHQRKMILEGLVLSLVEIVVLYHGFAYGNWIPALGVLPLILIIAGELTYMYWRDARYVCPSCHQAFQPRMAEFMFSSHTPKARKLTCTHCQTKGWCAEKSVETIAQSRDC